MTMAISKHMDDKTMCHAKLDTFECDGVFKVEGRKVTVMRGTLGTCPPEEFAYKFWAQTMDPKYKEKQLREMWVKVA